MNNLNGDEIVLKIKYFVSQYWLNILCVLIAIVSVVGSLVYVNLNKSEPCVCEECPVIEEETKETVASSIRVDIKGAVKNPGVYELAENSVVMDAINLAGGLKSTGVTTNINLSKKLTDEMVIYVFTKTEIKEQELSNQVVCEVPKCDCETVNITADGSNTNTTNNPSSTLEKVSINTAGLETLMTLDGVGESKAKAIIDYRTQNGGFKTLDEIKNVSGIGDSAYEKIKDKIKL